jgi:hypothetical protein
MQFKSTTTKWLPKTSKKDSGFVQAKGKARTGAMFSFTKAATYGLLKISVAKGCTLHFP